MAAATTTISLGGQENEARVRKIVTKLVDLCFAVLLRSPRRTIPHLHKLPIDARDRFIRQSLEAGTFPIQKLRRYFHNEFESLCFSRYSGSLMDSCYGEAVDHNEKLDICDLLLPRIESPAAQIECWEELTAADVHQIQKGAPILRLLDLSNCTISYAMLYRLLNELPNLQDLRLNNSKVRLPLMVSDLSLSSTALCSLEIAPFKQPYCFGSLPHLTRLVMDTSGDVTALKSLRNLTGLKSLSFQDRATFIADSAIRQSLPHLNCIEHLRLPKFFHLDLSLVQQILRMTSLRSLELPEASIPSTFAELTLLTTLPSLQDLNLVGSMSIGSHKSIASHIRGNLIPACGDRVRFTFDEVNRMLLRPAGLSRTKACPFF